MIGVKTRPCSAYSDSTADAEAEIVGVSADDLETNTIHSKDTH